jgi:transcriptional regulator with XRE-family HTH domain
MLERGLKQPSLRAFLKIAMALKVPPATLLKSTLKGLPSRK